MFQNVLDPKYGGIESGRNPVTIFVGIFFDIVTVSETKKNVIDYEV